MKNLEQEKGITLIALVITIIVLLILAGVTIAMITGDNGILKNTELAKIETRGASVEEARDIWFVEMQLAKITGGRAKEMATVLDELREQGLLTQEEVNIITADDNENNEITIGSRTISFKVGNKQNDEEEEHIHTAECYSTTCTGEFEIISTEEETWLTCEHVHDGDETNGGECYQTTSTNVCSGRVKRTAGAGFNSGTSVSYRCPTTGLYTVYGLVWEPCIACVSCGMSWSPLRNKNVYSCGGCNFFFADSSHSSYYPCGTELLTYTLSCNLDGATRDHTRTTEEIECKTCGVSGTYKEAVESFTCEICGEEHSIEAEGSRPTTHNSVPQYTTCGY